MPQATGSRSATLVVLARSHLNWLGIINDPYADRFLPAKWHSAVSILRWPGLGHLGRNPTFAYLAGRTLFYDRFVTKAMDDGIKQVVVLGAGYDSRAWRLARPDVCFFEVDLPATQVEKRSRAPDGGPTYVAADVTDPSLPDHLVTAGLQPNEPTAFTLEGLTMYLTEEHVSQLLRELSDLGGPAGRLAANFGVGFERQGSRRGRIGRKVMAAGGEQFRFRLPLADAPEFLSKAGWNLVRALTGPDLRDTFLRGTPLESVKVTTTGFAVEAAHTTP